MAEPLSITVGTVSLLSSITKLSMEIPRFVSEVRQASEDMNSVSEELKAVAAPLAQLKEGLSQNGSFVTSSLPENLSTSLALVISGCQKEVLGIENQLRASSMGHARAIRWAVSGRGEMNKRRSSLEAYKAALNMAMLVTQLSISQDVHGTMQQVLLQIKNLEHAARKETQGIMLQRFLEDTVRYAETVDGDSAVNDLDGESAILDTQEPTSFINTETVQLSQQKTPSAELLFDAIMRNDTLEAIRLISLGVDVNAVNNKGFAGTFLDGSSALALATFYGQNSVVEMLLEAGSNIELPDGEGWTPLIHSATYGHTTILERLLDKGANINACTPGDMTALAYAVVKRHRNIIEILLHRGADRNIKSKAGLTALEYASGKPEIRELFFDQSLQT